MGGCNGRLPADVCDLTPEQVAAWYAGPMAAMRARAGAGGCDGGGGPPQPPGLIEFRRKFEALGVRKTPDEWREAYRRHHGGE